MSELSTTAIKEMDDTMYQVIQIEATGYGNPDSPISFEKQLDSHELLPEVADRAAELIKSGECMTDIKENDDGCIDGRPSASITVFDSANGDFVEHDGYSSADHERAKVAGGGYMTGLAMLHALGAHDHTSSDDIKNLGSTLAAKGIVCGAHQDTHAQGGASGCGANDKYQMILQNASKFKKEISENVSDLLNVAGVPFDSDAFERTVDTWAQLASNDAYFEGESGNSRFEAIKTNIARAEQSKENQTLSPIAVSKRLDGDHKEDFVVINYVEGKTFSQKVFEQKLSSEYGAGGNSLAQAFVVDVPRIVTLAQALSQGNEDNFNVALHAGVAYQLATAATLTDGTLPIFLIKEV